MSKAILFVIMLISSSFVGCLGGEEELIEEIDNEDEGLRNAILALFVDIENGKTEKWCKMYPPHAYSLENEVITLSNETMIKACEEEIFKHYNLDEEMFKHYNLDYWRFAEEQGKLRYALNSYEDVKIDEVVASNSGPTYEVTVEIEICEKGSISSSWDCAFYSIENGNELILYFTEIP